MNSLIIENFEDLLYQLEYELNNFNLSKKDKTIKEFKLKSLSTSLNIIKNFDKPLNKNKNIEELSKLNGIGLGTIRRIKEINKTGKLSEVVINKNNKKYLDSLLNVYGIGPAFAFKLLKQDIKTVDDLKSAIENKAITVNNNILLGIKYYENLKDQIPRNQIKKHQQILKMVLDKLKKNNNINNQDLFIKICGSYRRKQKFNNDIDCLLVTKNKNKNWLNLYVRELKKCGYVLDSLNSVYIKKFMGFVKHENNEVIRLDIQHIDYHNYPTALLYFTGNKYFNLFIRKKAKEKGYKLNEYGLFKNNKKIKVDKEKDIFKILNIKYLKPENRNF